MSTVKEKGEEINKTNKIEELKQSEEIKNDNKNILVKFLALKNALLEERKKNSFLQKENISLKDEIHKKNEKILELKDEIKKYHDTVDKKENSGFFSELFNNINISGIKNEATIEKLNSENCQLKEDLTMIKEELNLIKTKLDNCLSENSIQKNQYELKIKELIQEKDNINNTYIFEKEMLNQKINEYDTKIRTLEEKILLFNLDREFFEKNINKLKNEIKTYKEQIIQKNNELQQLFQEQENIINNNTEYKQKVNNLKNIINEYKKAIDNSTRITDDYIFIGKIIPNTHYNNIINLNNGKKNNEDDIFLKIENKINDVKNEQKYKKIKIMFDFYRRKINIKIDEQKIITLETKNIIDIVHNLHVEGQIKIFFKIKDCVYDYLCQFTKKEAEFIIYFYNEMKNRAEINPALLGLYLATINPL